MRVGAVVRVTVRHTVNAVVWPVRRAARTLLVGGLACASILAAHDAAASAGAVIAPGQEDLLAEMLGRGAQLPGGCAFAGGQVEDVLARSTYQCPDGAVVVELRHPRQAGDTSARTEQFAITVTAGSPPADLLATLADRIRAREPQFIWASASGSSGAAVQPRPQTDFIDLDPRIIQAGWIVLLVSGPFLCWRGSRAVGVAGARGVLAAAVSVLVALTATWNEHDQPLHANGHAWREAREVLTPWGTRATSTTPFLHGKGGIALQWLLATAEYRLTERANPFRISRFATAAAAGASAFLALVLARSWWAGMAAGCVLGLMPLARMLSVSGSALTIPEWLLPWSLGLMIAAGRSSDRFLLAGAALAAALGTLSHTAMLAWPPALLVAWLFVARRDVRLSLSALVALLLVGFAWVVELTNAFPMIASRNQGPGGGLLGESLRGFMERNLLLDPQWVSPVLLPLLLLWVVCSLRRGYVVLMAASVLPLACVAVPFFAVTQCSSDAVRYQGALLGLVTSMAVAGVWALPLVSALGTVGLTTVRTALLASLVVLPLASQRPPMDPVAVEHELVADAVRRMEPGTLVILPKGRFDEARVIPDLPDFLLPRDVHMAFEGDPRIGLHRGPRLVYLGLACISWGDAAGATSSDLRPECRTLRRHTQPWAVHSFRSDELPQSRDGEVWTFHHLSTGVPFGFFAPERSREANGQQGM